MRIEVEVMAKKTTEKSAKQAYEEKVKTCKSREALYQTISGDDVKPLYLPKDTGDLDYDQDLGYPGEYPYTRGVHTNMYRGRLWTMRQFSGFGSPEDTNQRYKFLLGQGQTGLSVAFDMATIMGYDCDHPRAEGEVGRCGVAVSSLADMETIFEGIPLEKISTSMTINAPAAMLLCFYIAVGEKQGVDSTAHRHHTERHPQGIYRPEIVDIPTAALNAHHY